MKCPHCLVAVHPDFKRFALGESDSDSIGQDWIDHKPTPTFWVVSAMACPACQKAIINLAKRHSAYAGLGKV